MCTGFQRICPTLHHIRPLILQPSILALPLSMAPNLPWPEYPFNKAYFTSMQQDCIDERTKHLNVPIHYYLQPPGNLVHTAFNRPNVSFLILTFDCRQLWRAGRLPFYCWSYCKNKWSRCPDFFGTRLIFPQVVSYLLIQ